MTLIGEFGPLFHTSQGAKGSRFGIQPATSCFLCPPVCSKTSSLRACHKSFEGVAPSGSLRMVNQQAASKGVGSSQLYS